MKTPNLPTTEPSPTYHRLRHPRRVALGPTDFNERGIDPTSVGDATPPRVAVAPRPNQEGLSSSNTHYLVNAATNTLPVRSRTCPMIDKERGALPGTWPTVRHYYYCVAGPTSNLAGS